MELQGRTIALYGRFSLGARERLAAQIVRRGGVPARDLAQNADLLVIGARAAALVKGGALARKLAAAAERGVPVMGERAFAADLDRAAPKPRPAYPLERALRDTGWTRAEAGLFAAFDLVSLADEACAFGDVATLRAAAELRDSGCALSAIITILVEARDRAPAGRRRVVLTAAGAPALAWDDGLTTLDGQGLLPLPDEAGLDDVFAAALEAEAAGDQAEAARLFELCARADRRDPLSPYNAGNAHLSLGRPAEAALSYRRALARDPAFSAARYNLAQALEALGRAEEARAELEALLAREPGHADAVFNLAHLALAAGDLAAAEGLFDRYLALDPPAEWAEKARRALGYCTARAAAGS